MSQADEVAITTSSQHTTELARAMKEYAVLYEKWQQIVSEASECLKRSKQLQEEEAKLSNEVAGYRSKLKELIA